MDAAGGAGAVTADDLLKSQITETMLAGLSGRGDYPSSHSDMHACAGALLTMFDVKRKPLIRERASRDQGGVRITARRARRRQTASTEGKAMSTSIYQQAGEALEAGGEIAVTVTDPTGNQFAIPLSYLLETAPRSIIEAPKTEEDWRQLELMVNDPGGSDGP